MAGVYRFLADVFAELRATDPPPQPRGSQSFPQRNAEYIKIPGAFHTPDEVPQPPSPNPSTTNPTSDHKRNTTSADASRTEAKADGPSAYGIKLKRDLATAKSNLQTAKAQQKDAMTRIYSLRHRLSDAKRVIEREDEYSDRARLVKDQIKRMIVNTELRELQYWTDIAAFQWDIQCLESKIEREERLRRKGKEQYMDFERVKLPPRLPLRPRVRAKNATAAAVPVVPYATRIQTWREEVDAGFKDYKSITGFPAPPVEKECPMVACRRDPGVLAPVCQCSIRKAFKQVADLDLKKEYKRWHPDRFAACGMEKEATAVFVVLGGMVDEEEEEEEM